MPHMPTLKLDRPTLQSYIPELIECMEREGLRPVPIFINGVEAHTVVSRAGVGGLKGGQAWWVERGRGAGGRAVGGARSSRTSGKAHSLLCW